MKKLKVVICGSTFGQYYIRALQLMPEEFEIVGLLSNGSQRSKACADFYQIPLYTDISKLPKVDIACVVVRSRAIGGNGTELAECFLNRKVHVIQEQPVHPEDMELCYRAANKNGVLFQVGDLYPNLLEVSNFIKSAKFLNTISEPLYIKAAFSPQVSYPAMEIISKIAPSIHSWKITGVTKGVGPFDIFTGKIGRTPILIEYHNQVNPKDPDNYMHLLHSISLVYTSGRLILEDTFGPVMWKPRMHVPKNLYMPEENPVYPEYMLENSIENIGDFRSRSFKSVITEEWPVAIGKDLLTLKGKILSGDHVRSTAQKSLLCSKKWTEMTKILGYAELVNDNEHQYVPFENIENEIRRNSNGKYKYI